MSSPGVLSPDLVRPDVEGDVSARAGVNEPLPVLPAAPAQPTDPSSAADPDPVLPTLTWGDPAYWFGPVPWELGFEFGINGNHGINESLSLRVGGHIKRETEFWKLDTNIVYNKNTANSVETQNNAVINTRLDRLLSDSRWSLFYLNQNRYDEFQAFDLRVALNTGVGYHWIDTKSIDLIGSFGAGVSREFGAIDEYWAYEALFGMDYEFEFSATQRFSVEADYFPEWENLNLYRIVADIGWEIDLDRPKNRSLKFSLIDRYDSTPSGAKHNEINYAVFLIWKL